MPRVGIVAVIDTLEYLARGGRVPRIQAWASALLSVKPIIELRQQDIHLLTRTRTRRRAVAQLIPIFEQRGLSGKRLHLCVQHTNVLDEAEELAKEAQKRLSPPAWPSASSRWSWERTSGRACWDSPTTSSPRPTARRCRSDRAFTPVDRDSSRRWARCRRRGRDPALVVISGLPGTGKSQFARELQRRTGAVVLESDALRRLLFEKPSYSWQESRRLFAAIHAVAERLLCEGVSRHPRRDEPGGGLPPAALRDRRRDAARGCSWWRSPRRPRWPERDWRSASRQAEARRTPTSRSTNACGRRARRYGASTSSSTRRSRRAGAVEAIAREMEERRAGK